ncbi:hypothetical protein LJB91_03535, partial [Bacteroidales bacterium OttesenSCG-928-L03]|nr:hypothetical protein [Bacteroidales bacterium OttesenSCG-928-L03]
MKRISLFILSACCLTAVQAQDNLNRTLTIEKDYAPSIRDANKINELPEVKTPEVVKSEVQFSEYTMPYTVSPYLVNFAPSPLFTDLEKSDKRGYLNLGVSTLLDVDADLGYQLIHTDRDFFSIYLSNNYSNSKMSFVQTDQKNRMKLHDLWGGFDYKHVFNKAVFDLGGKYTFSRFNYYGLFPYANYEEDRPAPSIEDILTRKYTKDNKINRILDVYAGVSSRDGADLNYRFSAAYTHFGTRTGWVNYNNKLSENRILLGLDLSKEFDATWTIGFNGQFNGRFYSLDKDISTEYHVLFDRDNRYALALNPYFYTSGTNWQLRVGLHAGFIMGDYEKANIAPDVYFSFNPSPV